MMTYTEALTEEDLKVQPGSFIENKKPAEVAAEILRAIFSSGRRHHRQEQWTMVSNFFGSSITIGVDELTSNKNECGTSACVAGWATVLSGYKFRVHSKDGSAIWKTTDLVLGKEIVASQFALSEKVKNLGQEVLGLTEHEAEQLFLSLNDDEALARLYLMAENDGKFKGLPSWDEDLQLSIDAECEEDPDLYYCRPDMDDEYAQPRMEDEEVVADLVELAEKKYGPEKEKANV